MVSSEQHNLIFLRLPKNASTSLATWFIQNACDENDIWTGIGDSGYSPNNFPPEVLNKYKLQFRKIHLTLNELVDNNVIPYEVAKKRRIIGVVRNPYHRQLSLFFFKSRSSDKSPARFREEFRNGCHDTDRNNQILQSDYFKLGDEWAPNAEPWLYDHIDTRLKGLGIEEKHPLKTYKSNRKPRDMESLVEEYYDERTRAAVYQYYEEDFKLFNWEHLN